MLQNTINSWKFFLEGSSGDCIYQLAERLNCKLTSPAAILTKLFNDYSGGIELSYEAFLFDILKKQYGETAQVKDVENIEDALLVNIIHSAIKRCPEDERDVLLGYLGLPGNLDKAEIKKELTERAPSMDRFLLPGVALLLVDPRFYFDKYEAIRWPFYVDHRQFEDFWKVLCKRVSYGNELEMAILLIACHRVFIYQPDQKSQESFSEEILFDLPDDLFTIQPKTQKPYIDVPPREEFTTDLSHFKEFISYLLELSGHISRDNAETILRVLTGYPFESKQEKILWDGRQYRALFYAVKFMFKAKDGRRPKGKTYPVILNNTVYEPEVEDRLEWNAFANTEDFSNRIGDGIGKGISPLVLKKLYDLYPTVYTNPEKHVRKREKSYGQK